MLKINEANIYKIQLSFVIRILEAAQVNLLLLLLLLLKKIGNARAGEGD